MKVFDCRPFDGAQDERVALGRDRAVLRKEPAAEVILQKRIDAVELAAVVAAEKHDVLANGLDGHTVAGELLGYGDQAISAARVRRVLKRSSSILSPPASTAPIASP